MGADHQLEGGFAAGHPVVQVEPRPVATATPLELNTFRVPIFPIACWRLNDIRFDFDSSFVRPEAQNEVSMLANLVRQHPGAPLSVFGHADPTGKDDYNTQLSGRRAAAIYGLLTRKTDIWDDLYLVPYYGDNWGLKSIQWMLDALLYSPGPIDG